MHLKFEHYAATSMLGSTDSPPRRNGKMYFDRQWERDAFGIAIALSKRGHYEWEDFRQGLIAAIGKWESEHATDDPSWDYYERWLEALERLAVQSGVIDPRELEDRTNELAQLNGCRLKQTSAQQTGESQ